MSAHDTLTQLISQNPGHRWAISRDESAIAVWSESLGRFYTVAAATVTTPPMWVINPGEILVNGKHLDYGWVPTKEAAVSDVMDGAASGS